jgi:hypothetical protein
MAISDELTRIADLRKEGALSEAEFRAAKARLLPDDSAGTPDTRKRGGLGPWFGTFFFVFGVMSALAALSAGSSSPNGANAANAVVGFVAGGLVWGGLLTGIVALVRKARRH